MLYSFNGLAKKKGNIHPLLNRLFTFVHLSFKTMNPYNQYSISPLDLFSQAITLAEKWVEAEERIERRNRNDDNMTKLVVQATRLYEQGAISKQQLTNIIQQLPDNRPTIDVNTSSDVAQPKPTVDDLLAIINRM